MFVKLIENNITTMKVDLVVSEVETIHEGFFSNFLKKIGINKFPYIKICKSKNLSANNEMQVVLSKYKENNNIAGYFNNCLSIVKHNKFRSIAFPIFDYDNIKKTEREIKFAIDKCEKFLQENYLKNSNYAIKNQLKTEPFIYLVLDRKYKEKYQQSFYIKFLLDYYKPKSKSIEEDIRFCLATETLKEIEESQKKEKTFSEKLFELIDSKGLTDAQVYNKVHMDRRLFSKIRSERDYHPSKKTIILLIFALELNLEDAEDLFKRAGYGLSTYYKLDLAIRYFLEQKVYDLIEINNVLEYLGEDVLY